jgi:hypothetical protein
MSISNEHSENSARFDRIEGKLDAMSETIISLARAEEKLIAIEKNNAVMLGHVVKLDERMNAQELIQITLTNTYSNFSKVFWSIVTGTITSAVIYWLSTHLKV